MFLCAALARPPPSIYLLFSDSDSRRGHLLDGGRPVPAARDCGTQEKVQLLPVCGRGALDRRTRQVGQGYSGSRGTIFVSVLPL